MSVSKPPSLGKLELRMLRVLWRDGSVTARQLTEALNAETGARFVAHSTVQTLLRKLEAKRAVRHESDGRIFTFYPLVAQNDATQNATRDLLTRVFDGSVYGLMAHLLRHENISAEERNRLRKLIDTADDSADADDKEAAQ